MKKLIVSLIIITVVIAILSGEEKSTRPPDLSPSEVTPSSTTKSAPETMEPTSKVTLSPTKSAWDEIRNEQLAQTSSDWSKPILVLINNDHWQDGAYISGDGLTLYWSYFDYYRRFIYYL